MSEVTLSEAQIAEFHERGFVHLREFIPHEMLVELRVGYDAATRGEYDVDGWNQKIAAGDILQLGMPNTHIPGWRGMNICSVSCRRASSFWATISNTNTIS